MARIRTIKPEFPQSESMGRISRDARLAFIEMWTLADDEGRLRGNSRMLASLLFPYDDDAPGLIEKWIEELEREGCIVRYSIAGQTYLQVVNWLNHQKIDRPSTSKIPPFDDASRIIASPRDWIKDQGPRIKDQGSSTDTEAQPESPAKPNAEVDDAFEAAWKVYPKRAGGNSKADAQKQWNARLKSGVDPKDMLAGVQRYAKFCDVTGKTGTEYVKQAATFFGRGMHFAEPYNLPRTAAVNNHTNFQEKTYVGTPDDEIDWLNPGDGHGVAGPAGDDVSETRRDSVP